MANAVTSVVLSALAVIEQSFFVVIRALPTCTSASEVLAAYATASENPMGWENPSADATAAIASD